MSSCFNGIEQNPFYTEWSSHKAFRSMQYPLSSYRRAFLYFFLSQTLQKKRTIAYAIVLLQGGNKYKIQENVCS